MNLGVIGAGNMARAIIGGIIASRAFKDTAIAVSDSSEEALAEFAIPNITKLRDNKTLARSSDVILFAVKPAHAPGVFAEIEPVCTADKIIVSIMAGVKLSALRGSFPRVRKFARVMPNLAARVGKSMNALCGENLTTEEKRFVRGILDSTGRTEEVDESLFDVITAVSGSGPAYFFMFIDALRRAGCRLGLPENSARIFAAQTALGAAAAVLETEDTAIIDMRDAVCSKGGTTIEAVKILDGADIYGTIDRAVEAAYTRAVELGQKA